MTKVNQPAVTVNIIGESGGGPSGKSSIILPEPEPGPTEQSTILAVGTDGQVTFYSVPDLVKKKSHYLQNPKGIQNRVLHTI